MRWVFKLFDNTRFYILAFALLASIFVASYARVTIPSDQLSVIRTEQVYGLLSIILIYFAVILTPLEKIFGKRPAILRLTFARRGIGVAAAYFAILHTLIAFFLQTDGFSGFGLLPLRFQVAFFYGLIALVILFLMAITSVDKIIDWMTFPNWKMLHRLIYVGGVLIVVHVWLIGTHIEHDSIRYAAYAALMILIALESTRMTITFIKKDVFTRRTAILVGCIIFAISTAGVVALPKLAKNYHAEHAAEGHGHE